MRFSTIGGANNLTNVYVSDPFWAVAPLTIKSNQTITRDHWVPLTICLFCNYLLFLCHFFIIFLFSCFFGLNSGFSSFFLSLLQTFSCPILFFLFSFFFSFFFIFSFFLFVFFFIFFLVACKRLYKPLCRSVRWSVRRSVGPSHFTFFCVFTLIQWLIEL